MSFAIVEVVSPILVNGEWVRSGEVSIPADEAKQHEALGLVDIVNIDGAPVVWGACCSGDHPHEI